jgi:glycosyltransferase involved in cell wall biosynthesis
MRITFILPSVSMGGGIRVVAIYAKALVERGHSVRLISVPPKPPAVGTRIKSIFRGGGPSNPPVLSGSHLDGAGLDHQVLDCWRPVVDNDVPNGDVVVATWWRTAEWVMALSPSKGAKAYFIQGHEVFPHLPVERSRATYRMPLHKIVVAPWLKRIMGSEYGDQIVDVVPNSVDRGQFFAAKRGKQEIPTVGFNYATLHSKGLDVTLEAIRLVQERIPKLRTIAFGRQQPTPEMPLPEGAEHFVLPAQDSLRQIYARCDVWVTAGRTEGFGLPAMEAMACRTPVVSTQGVCSGWDGIRVGVDDVVGFANGIEWVLSRSDEDWRKLSENAHAKSAANSWQKSAELFEAALEHACRRAELGEIEGRPNCHASAA